MAKGGSREKAKSLCDKQRDCSFRDHGCSLLEHYRETRPRGEQTSLEAARPWIFNSIVHRPLFKLAARHDLWCKFDASQRWNGRKETVGNSCLATLCRRFFSTRFFPPIFFAFPSANRSESLARYLFACPLSNVFDAIPRVRRFCSITISLLRPTTVALHWMPLQSLYIRSLYCGRL